MRDYLTLGSVPSEEPCTQVTNEPDYLRKQKIECREYIKALRLKFGEEPEGAELVVKGFPHDFGTYCEVVVYYDDSIEEAVDYAFKCESNGPLTWAEVGMSAP